MSDSCTYRITCSLSEAEDFKPPSTPPSFNNPFRTFRFHRKALCSFIASMSFGVSVGDFVLLTQIAHKTFRNCQEAGDEYVEIANAVRCLHSVLRTLRAEVQRPESKIFKQDPASTAQLLETAEGCKNVLDSLDYILAKYEGLKVNSQAGARKKIWQRFRFGSKVEELVVIRSKLVTYTSTLLILIDTLHVQAIDRVEIKIDGRFVELNEQFEKMRKEIFTIATLARSEERKRSTMSTLSLSTYAGDEKIVWQDFRRELIKKGFNSKSLERNKHILLAYINKLDQSGLLDGNNMTSDADNLNPRWAKKMSADTMNSLADLQLTEKSPFNDGLPQAIINKLHPKPIVDEGDDVEKTNTYGEDSSGQEFALPFPRPSNPVVSYLRKPPPKPASRPNSSFSTRSAQSSPDVMASTSRNVFPFLSLPSQIRNRIYPMCLSLPHQPVNIVRQPLGNHHRNRKARDILQVCRQIRDEAWFYYYQLNHFHFDTVYEMYCFLSNIDLERRQKIRRITFTYGNLDLDRQFGNKYYRSAWRLLRSCDRLQFFCLRITDNKLDYIRDHDLVSWHYLLDLKGLCEVSVQGSRQHVISSKLIHHTYYESDHPLADQLRLAWWRPRNYTEVSGI